MKELTANINGQNIHVYTDDNGDIFLEEVNYRYNDNGDASNRHSPEPLLAGISSKGLEIYVGIKHNSSLGTQGIPGITLFLCDKEGKSLCCGVIATLSPQGITFHPCVDSTIAPFLTDTNGYAISDKF